MEHRICGLIVAAGLSSRMGCFKPLMPLRGKTILENTIDSLLMCGVSQIVVVLGYRGQEVETVLRSRYLPGTILPVYNQAYASTDMLASIQIGAAALPPCSAFFLMPGDMPVVTKETFLAVCHAHSDSTPSITFPTLDGYRKHPPHYAMLGYQLRNTVTEFGSVARGVCHVEEGFLRDITERTKIFKRGNDAAFTEDGETFTPISGDSLVSMNFWGFTPQILDEIWAKFPAFLEENLPKNPEKCEFYLPTVVGNQLADETACVRVLPCMEAWYGVTYKEDLPNVKLAIQRLKNEGKYPQKLWE